MAIRSTKICSNFQIIFTGHLSRARVEASKWAFQRVRFLQNSKSQGQAIENWLAATKRRYIPSIQWCALVLFKWAHLWHRFHEEFGLRVLGAKFWNNQVVLLRSLVMLSVLINDSFHDAPPKWVLRKIGRRGTKSNSQVHSLWSRIASPHDSNLHWMAPAGRSQLEWIKRILWKLLECPRRSPIWNYRLDCCVKPLGRWLSKQIIIKSCCSSLPSSTLGQILRLAKALWINSILHKVAREDYSWHKVLHDLILRGTFNVWKRYVYAAD